MTKYKFFAQWSNPPHAKSEKVDTTRHVSLTGYVPLEQRIQEMMQAGVRLNNMRQGGTYDTDLYPDTDADDIPLDPTRDKGIDPAEVTEIAYDVRQALKAQRNANMKAPKAPVAVPNATPVTPPTTPVPTAAPAA